MAEQSVASARAAILYFNAQDKKWMPAGTGYSRVDLYKHTEKGTYRVVGRNMQDKTVKVGDRGGGLELDEKRVQTRWYEL